MVVFKSSKFLIGQLKNNVADLTVPEFKNLPTVI